MATLWKMPSVYTKTHKVLSKIKFDTNQTRLLQHLDSFHQDLVNYNKHCQPQKSTLFSWCKTIRQSFYSAETKPPTGFYIHGSPGTGKTMLMDILYNSYPFKNKKRVHFNSFMIEIHKQLHELRQRRNNMGDGLLNEIAFEIAQNNVLICLDEFQVTDIVDAVLLRELFYGLFRNGCILLTTSNRHPNELYKNGMQREEIFIPFLNVLKKHCFVYNLDGGVDYRERGTRLHQHFFYPDNTQNNIKFQNAFSQITNQKPPRPQALKTFGREIVIPAAAGSGCMLSFASLCEQPNSAADFRAIALNFRTVFLRGLRHIKRDESDVLRRFITLVDELYAERRVLVLLSSAPLEKLFEPSAKARESHDEVFAWERCKSRLAEMQSKEYLDHLWLP